MCLLKPDCVGKVVGVKLTNACFTHKFDALHDILDTGCLLFLCILEICWNVFKIYFNRRRIYGTQIKLYFYIKSLFYSLMPFLEDVDIYLIRRKEVAQVLRSIIKQNCLTLLTVDEQYWTFCQHSPVEQCWIFCWHLHPVHSRTFHPQCWFFYSDWIKD